MKCQNCGSENAVIHLTQIVDDEMKTLHLCERGAAEKGLETSTVPENFPLSPTTLSICLPKGWRSTLSSIISLGRFLPSPI